MLSGILTRFKEYVESLEGDDVRRFLELTNGMSSRLPESYAQITLTVAISYA